MGSNNTEPLFPAKVIESPLAGLRDPCVLLRSSLCSLAGLEAWQLHPMAVQTRFHYRRQHQKDPLRGCLNTKLRDVSFIYLHPPKKAQLLLFTFMGILLSVITCKFTSAALIKCSGMAQQTAIVS